MLFDLHWELTGVLRLCVLVLSCETCWENDLFSRPSACHLLGTWTWWGMEGWRWQEASWRWAEGPSLEESIEAICRWCRLDHPFHRKVMDWKGFVMDWIRKLFGQILIKKKLTVRWIPSGRCVQTCVFSPWIPCSNLRVAQSCIRGSWEALTRMG